MFDLPLTYPLPPGGFLICVKKTIHMGINSHGPKASKLSGNAGIQRRDKSFLYRMVLEIHPAPGRHPGRDNYISWENPPGYFGSRNQIILLCGVMSPRSGTQPSPNLGVACPLPPWTRTRLGIYGAERGDVVLATTSTRNA